MAILTRSATPDEMVLAITGRFDFSVLGDFTRAYEAAPRSVKRWVLDLEGTTFMDSSALGMLLIFRDHAGGDDSSIQIINCGEDVRRTLINFDSLFEISMARP